MVQRVLEREGGVTRSDHEVNFGQLRPDAFYLAGTAIEHQTGSRIGGRVRTKSSRLTRAVALNYEVYIRYNTRPATARKFKM
jgi:hypothetical protein